MTDNSVSDLVVGADWSVLAELRLTQRPADLSDLTWYLDVGLDRGPIGPAGTAKLDLPDGSSLWVDYALPHRLLRVTVPYGESRIREVDSADAVRRLHAEGGFAEETAHWLSGVLGSNLMDELSSTVDLEFLTTVPARPTWESAGRLAVLRARLAETGIHLDGLHALEALRYLDQGFGGRRNFPDLTSALVDRARGVTAVLDAQWYDQLSPRIQNDVRTALDIADRVSVPVDLGPLLRELRSRDEAQLFDLADSEIIHIDLAARVPSFLDRDEVIEPTQVTWRVDHSASHIVEGVTTEVEGGHLTLLLFPLEQGAALMPALQIRVSHDGDIVASALSTKDMGQGYRQSELALPAGLEGESILVVIGVELDLEGWTDASFDERQVEHYTRRLVDARRAGDTAEVSRLEEELQALQVADHGSFEMSADGAIEAAGSAEASRRLALRVGGPDPEAPTLAAIRSLTCYAGDLVAAGNAEAKRLLLFEEEELDQHELFALAQALLEAGHRRDADVLLSTLFDEHS